MDDPGGGGAAGAGEEFAAAASMPSVDSPMSMETSMVPSPPQSNVVVDQTPLQLEKNKEGKIYLGYGLLNSVFGPILLDHITLSLCYITLHS